MLGDCNNTLQFDLFIRQYCESANCMCLTDNVKLRYTSEYLKMGEYSMFLTVTICLHSYGVNPMVRVKLMKIFCSAGHWKRIVLSKPF
jgi:hypothetical protein